MEIHNYNLTKNIEYSSIGDRFNCTYNIELEYEEKVYFLEFDIYSNGNNEIWSISRMFFEEGKIDGNITLDIKNLLEDNIQLFSDPILNEYQNINKRYENSEPLWLIKFSIVNEKYKDDEVYGWILSTYVTNEQLYIKFDIKQGSPNFSMKKWCKFMNWESNTWYPGWKEDMTKQIKSFKNDWDYSNYYYDMNNFDRKNELNK